jgi:hypothetical protein
MGESIAKVFSIIDPDFGAEFIGCSYGYNIPRCHPILIFLVEAFGKVANGDCAKLKVVEIPSEVEWEIDEYDGTEHIAEVHRTWY